MIDEIDLLRRLFDSDTAVVPPNVDATITAQILVAESKANYRPNLATGFGGFPVSPVVHSARIHRSAASQDRGHSGRRLALGVLLSLLVVLLGANIASAATAPGSVAAIPIPAPSGVTALHSFIPVASVSTPGTRSLLSLASDPSGRSFGCVSLNPIGTTPASTLPDSARAVAPANTFCALHSPNGANNGPGIGYEISIDPHLPAVDQGAVAFGYAPAGTAVVRITLAKDGPLILRLLKPTATVRARVLGASLQLPIDAWEGPNLSGYSVTSIQSVNQAGVVTASLRFGRIGQ